MAHAAKGHRYVDPGDASKDTDTLIVGATAAKFRGPTWAGGAARPAAGAAGVHWCHCGRDREGSAYW